MRSGIWLKARIGSQRGSVSVELIGVLPALVVVVLVAAQFVSAGYALWSASVAARAGARAAHTGSSFEPAARRSLPEALRGGAVIAREGGGVVSARVPVPRVLPILPGFRVEAKSALEPAHG